MLAAARRLPVGEALPALGLVLVAIAALGPQPALLGFGWLAVVTPRLVGIDLAEHRLPDAIVLPGYPIVLVAVVADAWVTNSPVAEGVLAGLVSGIVFLLLHAVGGMGFGDVKLAPLLGGLAAIALSGGALLWLVLAFLVGGVGAVVTLIRRGTGARMAFGPPMLASAWLVLALS